MFGEQAGEEIFRWLGFAAAFDAIFLALSLLLFRFVYSGDE